MIIRKMYPEQYEQACRYLQENGKSSILDASYEVTMRVDDIEYQLRLQPCPKRQLAVLQAVKIFYIEEDMKYELILDNLPLSILLELFLIQHTSTSKNKAVSLK